MCIIDNINSFSIHSSMALSYYSNWGSFQQMDSDPELQALMHDAWNADYFADPNDLFYSQNCNNNSSLLYDDFTNGVPFDHNIATDPFLQHREFQLDPLSFHYPKRQKPCDFEEIYSSFFAPNPCLQDYSPPEIVVPPPFLDFPAAGFSNGSCDSVTKEATSLSAQSVAARQRRRRITEKTQELGKLVPGGQKMNTAEMLQSAYKYIKFLQAQVQLLEFVGSNNLEVTEAPFEGVQVLQILLESPLIQEKLYSTENCLLPHKFVQELRSDDQLVKSNPSLLPALEKDH